MAQLAAHMPVAELVSPPKLVGAALGVGKGPELHQDYADDYLEPGTKAAPMCCLV